MGGGECVCVRISGRQGYSEHETRTRNARQRALSTAVPVRSSRTLQLYSGETRYPCDQMGLNERIEDALESLEALYFFPQGLDGEAGQHLGKVRHLYQVIPSQGRRGL